MRSLLPAVLLAATVPVFASSFSSPSVSATRVSRFAFEKNLGQTDAAVEYLTRTATGVVFFTKNGLVLNGSRAWDHESRPLRFEFIGANRSAGWTVSDALPERVSYHVGNDPKRWARDIERFSRLTRKQAYPGIDVTYYGSDGNLEYDFVVAPGAHPDRIRFRLSGADQARITAAGDLEIRTGAGLIVKRLPAIYQLASDGSKQKVDGHLRQDRNGNFGFALGAYDATRTLYIDPVLEAASYLGGSGDDKLVYSDSSRDISVGTTTSIDFAGAEPARRFGRDILLRIPGRYAPTALIILGGSGDDDVTAATANRDYLLITGTTTSDDLSSPASYLGVNSVGWPYKKRSNATQGFVLHLPLTIYSSARALLGLFGGTGAVAPSACWLSDYGSEFAVTGTTATNDVLSDVSIFTPRRAIAGGRDGFLLTGLAPYSSPDIVFFGGDGDDLPNAVRQTTINNAASYLVAGETSSQNYPTDPSGMASRHGETDAFLTTFLSKGHGLEIGFSTLYGGAGADAATTLFTPGDGTIGMGGRTSSSDFPLLNPWQSTYGGGNSDAFVVRFDSSFQVVSSSLYGGFGDDTVTASVVDVGGGWFVVGDTTSSDLKLKNQLQAYGGGWDGFLLQFLADGSLYQSSYFGGAADEHVFGVTSSATGEAELAGSTTSANLTVVPSGSSALVGGTDGFRAVIQSSVLQGKPIHGGKDFLTLGVAQLARPSAFSSGTVKLTSSLPSVVLLAGDAQSPGAASMEVHPASDGSVYFFTDCRDSSSKASIQLAAPGYTTASIPVSCHPTQLKIGMSPSTAIAVGNSSIWISAGVFAVDGATGTSYGVAARRPGAPAATVLFESTQPGVGAARPASTTVAEGTLLQSPVFVALSPGQTTITAVSQDGEIAASNAINVSVGPTISAYNVNLVRGWQTSYAWSVSDTNGRVSTPGMVTSENGDVIALSADGTLPGTNRIVYPNGPQYSDYVSYQPLAATSSLKMYYDATGVPQVIREFTVGDPALYLSSTSGEPRTAETSIGQPATVLIGVGAQGSTRTVSASSPTPQLGTVHLKLKSADESIVASAEGDWIPGKTAPQFALKGLAEGQTTVRLIPPDGIPTHSVFGDSLTVVVKRAKPSMKNAEVGRDLATSMVVNFGAALDTDTVLTIRVDHPELAQLAISRDGAAAAEIQIPVNAGAYSAAFLVYGLADSGDVQVTADLASYGTASAKVLLEPSGIGWDRTSVETTLYGDYFPPTIGVVPFALDAATGFPVSRQSLRPNVSRWITAEVGDSRIATLNEGTTEVKSLGSSSQYSFNTKQTGQTQFTLSSADGNSIVRLRRTLPLTVKKPSFGTSAIVVGRNQQTGLQLGQRLPSNPPANLMVNITSLDPSKVLIARNSTQPGVASLQVTRQQASDVMVQALSGEGTAQIKLSADNFEDGIVNVSFLPVLATVAPYTNSVEQRNGAWYTSALAPEAGLYVTLTYNNGTPASPRPGAEPIEIQISSSDPSVATVTPTSVSFKPGSEYSRLVTLKQTGKLGRVVVQLKGPEGVVLFPDGGLAINVEASSVALPNFMLGKDLVASVQFNIPQTLYGLSSPAILNIESGDPSKVLLSRAPDQPGQPSVSLPISGMSYYSSVTLHALQGEGLVTLRISGPGFSPSTSQVLLTSAAVTTNFDANGKITSDLGANPPQFALYARTNPAALPSGFTMSSYNETVRPGARITMDIISSDPSVAQPDPQNVAFEAGVYGKTVSINAVAPGSTSIQVVPQPGVVALPPLNAIPVTISQPAIKIDGGMTVGKDLAWEQGLVSSNSRPLPATVRVESSDPARLLVSTDCNTPGQASVLIAGQGYGRSTFCLQGLADEGNVSIRTSASGYRTADTPIQLTPVTAIFGSAIPTLIAGQEVSGQVIMAVLPESGYAYSQAGKLRPGAAPTVELTSTNPGIAEVKQSPVVFGPDGRATFLVRGIQAGKTTLRLAAPSNGKTANVPEQRQTTVTVVSAQP